MASSESGMPILIDGSLSATYQEHLRNRSLSAQLLRQIRSEWKRMALVSVAGLLVGVSIAGLKAHRDAVPARARIAVAVSSPKPVEVQIHAARPAQSDVDELMRLRLRNQKLEALIAKFQRRPKRKHRSRRHTAVAGTRLQKSIPLEP
ncbi:MAG: hypothetical protein JOZ62_19855 [Acidobacteriaceae bacterium]|nr:hypothetical protein [Acidobacteriaceae bacterium]